MTDGETGLATMTPKSVVGPETIVPKTFVLIHGAWHGGWCWTRVAEGLLALGHRVYVPTLTGLGERSHLLSDRISLTTHVDDVVNLLRWNNLAGVTLCGHSYAGFVVSAVAEKVPSRTIDSIIFLDAFVPENGQCVEDVTGPVTDNPAWKAGLEQNGGLAVPAPPAAFFGVNEADRAWVDAKCTAHPYRTFKEKISLSGARERIARKVYIRAAENPEPLYSPTFSKLKTDPSWNTHEIEAGHDVMVDAPEKLIEILVGEGG